MDCHRSSEPIGQVFADDAVVGQRVADGRSTSKVDSLFVPLVKVLVDAPPMIARLPTMVKQKIADYENH